MLQARAKDRRTRVERPQLPHNACILPLRRGAHDHESSRPRERAQRFAQISQRENRAAAERIQGIDQHQIQIAPQPGVLESIVQKEDVRPVFFFEQTAGDKTVGADACVRVARLHEDLRLISGEADGRGLSRLHQNRSFDGAAAISAREDGGMMAALAQTLGQMIHHGSFPGPTHADAADADHRRGEPPRVRHFAPLLPGADGGPNLSQRPEQESRRAQLVPAWNGQILPAENFGHGFSGGAALRRRQRRGTGAQIFAQFGDRRSASPRRPASSLGAADFQKRPLLAKFCRDGREVFQMRPCHDRLATSRRLQNIVAAAPRERASHEDHIGNAETGWPVRRWNRAALRRAAPNRLAIASCDRRT